MAQGAGKAKSGKGGLLEGLSMAQIVAGALAAVTSMLLASRIGIAGSVIGVAVGSVVSAVASQLYKKFLTVSAEKLRYIRPGEVQSGGEFAGVDSTTHRIDAAASGNPCIDVADVAIEGKTMPFDAVAIRRSRTPRIDDASLREDVTVRRAQALRERKKKVQRRVIAVSAMSALAAVLVSALIVNFATMGEGLGSKSPSVFSASTANKVMDAKDESASTSSETPQANNTGSSSGGTSSDHPSPGAGSDPSSPGTQEDGKHDPPSSSGSSDGTQSGGGTGGGQPGGGSSGSTAPDAGATAPDSGAPGSGGAPTASSGGASSPKSDAGTTAKAPGAGAKAAPGAQPPAMKSPHAA